MKYLHTMVRVENIENSLGEITKFLDFEETKLPTLIDSQKVNVCFLKTSEVYIEFIASN